MPEQVIANPVIKMTVDFSSINGQMNQARGIVSKQGKAIEQSLSKSFTPISNAAIKMGRSITQALKSVTVPLTGLGVLAVKKLFDSNTKAGEEAKKKWASFKSVLDSNMTRIGYYITQSKIFGSTMWQWLDKFGNLLKRINGQDVQKLVDLLSKAAVTMGLIKAAIIGTRFAQGTLNAIKTLGKGTASTASLTVGQQAATLGGASALGSTISSEILAKAIAEKVTGGSASTSISIPNFISKTLIKNIKDQRDLDALTNTMLGKSTSIGAGNVKSGNFKGSSALRDFGYPVNPLSRMNYFRNYGYPGGGIGTAVGAASMSLGRDALAVGREFKGYMSRIQRQGPPPIPFSTKYPTVTKIAKYTAASAAILIAYEQLFRQMDNLLKAGEFKRYGINAQNAKDGLMDLGSGLLTGVAFVGNAIEAAITLLNNKIGTSIGNIISPPDATGKIRDPRAKDYLKMISPLAFLTSNNSVDLGGKEWYKPFTAMTEREARDRGMSEEKRLAYNQRLEKQQTSDMLLPISSEPQKELLSKRMAELTKWYNQEVTSIKMLTIVNPEAAKINLDTLDKTFSNQIEMVKDWVESLPETIQQDLKATGFNKGIDIFSKSIKESTENAYNAINKTTDRLEAQKKMQNTLREAAESEKEAQENYGKGVRGVFAKWLDMQKEDGRLGYTGERVGVTDLTSFATRVENEWQEKLLEHNKKTEEIDKEANGLLKEMRDALNKIKEKTANDLSEQAMQLVV